MNVAKIEFEMTAGDVLHSFKWFVKYKQYIKNKIKKIKKLS